MTKFTYFTIASFSFPNSLPFTLKSIRFSKHSIKYKSLFQTLGIGTRGLLLPILFNCISQGALVGFCPKNFVLPYSIQIRHQSLSLSKSRISKTLTVG